MRRLIIALLILFILIGSTITGVLIASMDNNNDDDDQNSGESVTLNEDEVINDIHDNINSERSDRGLPQLELNDDVSMISQYKSEQMASKDYVDHTSPDGETVEDRFSEFDSDCDVIGENLAQTYYMDEVDTNYDDVQNYESESELARGIVNQLMNSEDHKEAIVDDIWESHGIGFEITDENKVFTTQKFCKTH